MGKEFVTFKRALAEDVEKMKLNVTRNSLLVRMLAIFLLAIVPLYIIGFSLYSAGAEQLITETLNAKCAQIEFYIQSMQSELTRLGYLSISSVNGSTIGMLVNRYPYLNDYARSVQVNALRDDLRAIRMSSQYADTVTAYLFPIERTLNDYLGYEMLDEEQRRLAVQLSDTRGLMSCQNQTPYIVSALRDSNFYPIYLVAVRLNSRMFAEDLKRLDGAAGARSALVWRGSQAVAVSDQNASVLWQLAGAQTDRQKSDRCRVQKMNLGGTDYRVVYADAPSMDLRLYNFIPEGELHAAAGRYKGYIFGFILATLALLCVLLPSMVSMVHRPLHRMMDAFEKVENGDMTVRIAHHRKDEFRQVYQGFNQMVQNLDQYINRALKQEILLRRAEVLQLQSQINPHFLYNSYFMLHRMIKQQDWERAGRFSRYMGEYFRYITRSAQQTLPLSREVEHARIYAEIQGMRFDGRIRVEFGDLPEQLKEMNVPKLILQPILENAFEHGMREKIADGLVRVQFEMEGFGCRIQVEDNGEELTDERLEALRASLDAPEGEMTALRNIHRRLNIVLPQCGGIHLSRSPLGGLQVTLVIQDVPEGERSDELDDR